LTNLLLRVCPSTITAADQERISSTIPALPFLPLFVAVTCHAADRILLHNHVSRYFLLARLKTPWASFSAARRGLYDISN